jgi:hypothetical protein
MMRRRKRKMINNQSLCVLAPLASLRFNSLAHELGDDFDEDFEYDE